DPTWRNLTALRYHYHTQPLPTVLAWYADKLPGWFQRASTFGVLAIELGTPFLIFMPRRIRMAGAFVMITLQGLIFLTGNYTFFILFTIAFILFLFDAGTLEGLRRYGKISAMEGGRPSGASRPTRMGLAFLTAVLLTLGATRMMETIEGGAPEPLNSVARI